MHPIDLSSHMKLALLHIAATPRQNCSKAVQSHLFNVLFITYLPEPPRSGFHSFYSLPVNFSSLFSKSQISCPQEVIKPGKKSPYSKGRKKRKKTLYPTDLTLLCLLTGLKLNYNALKRFNPSKSEEKHQIMLLSV